MRILCERQAHLEIEIHDHEGRMHVGFEDEAARKPGRSRAHFHKLRHECDDCGQSKPDVDLWAESHDTGEEIWLCIVCGDL